MWTQARKSRGALAVVSLIGLGSFGLVSGGVGTLNQAAADPVAPAADRSDEWPITECGTSNGRGCTPPRSASICSDRPSPIRPPSPIRFFQ